MLVLRYGRNWPDKLRGDQLGDKICDTLTRVCKASFWEWCDGSALIFWRWSKDHQRAAIWGYPVRVTGTLPQHKCTQIKDPDPAACTKIRDRLDVVRRRRYVQKGFIVSLTSYFAV